MCSKDNVAPAASLYIHAFRNSSPRWRLIGYQGAVLLITYFSYTSYHLAKKSFSVVKSELSQNCTITSVNNTCHSWEPFDSPKSSKDLFALLDCAFLLSYAFAMFISGYIAEHTNIRLFLSSGMFLTGILTAATGIAYYADIHELSFFILLQILTGIAQSSGWPCVVESVGVWFKEGRRGFIMGVWNTHTSVGNILGSAIAGIFVDDEWGLSFIVPGMIIFFFGIVVYFFLIPDPAHVRMERDKKVLEKSIEEANSRILPSPEPDRYNVNQDMAEESRAIGIWGALRIPGVVEYSLCLFFAKLVSYTFLFWLPYYIRGIKIAGKRYTPSQAADWAILFDVGGAIGGIVAGFLTDITHYPAIVNVVMLLCAGPSLFLFYFHGLSHLGLFIFYMVLAGFFVNGPYALITTAISASLGTHECLRGNTKAMAVVTSIIDGTGSLGAALGPLLAGVISSKTSWSNVFYMLIVADIIAAMFLSRQFVREIKAVWSQYKTSCGNVPRQNLEETKPLIST